MPDRDNRLIELAVSLADGTPIDWDAAESAAASDSERQQIRHMRLVRELVEGQPGSSRAVPGPLHESLLHPSDETTSRSDTDPTTPVAWGPLRVIEKIGRGRFGDVYRAWDPRLDREVALKLLRRRSAERDGRGSSVIEEGRLLAKVRHGNVVTVHGAECIDDRIGLWMELVRGRTLEEELVARGPVPPAEIVSIGVDVCRALSAVHRAGLVHRDIKAQNVMRDEDGRLVLMDFGTGLDTDSADATSLAGTPLYLAPEVIDGGAATVQSDVYSVGVLLYHLATGGFPMGGRTLRDVRRAHAEGPHRRLAESRPDIPRSLARTIDRALSPVPSDRFEDAEAMARALGADMPGRRPLLMRWPVLAALAAGVSVVLAGGIWFGWLAGRSGPAVPFASRDWVLVTAFDNRTGEPQLDNALELAFERELSASSYVNVVPRARVNDALLQMRKSVDARVDRALGRDVARRDGAIRALVGGDIQKTGQAYDITASIVAPRDGSIAATVNERARDSADILPAVRRAALRMRELLGEALTSIAASRAELAKVTTPSMQAFQYYSQASLLLSQVRGQPTYPRVLAAQQLLRAAISVDPDFASAHILLALALRPGVVGRGGPLADAVKSADRAMSLVDRTTEVERLFIIGTCQKLHGSAATDPAEKTNHFQRAADSYETLLQHEPDHSWALDQLAETYGGLKRPADQVRIRVRLAALRPQSFVWQAGAALDLVRGSGDVASARRLIESAPALVTLDDIETDPIAVSWARLFPAHDAWLATDVTAALRAVDAVAADLPSWPPTNARLHFGMQIFTLYLTMGRLDQAGAIVPWIPLTDGFEEQPTQAKVFVEAERGDMPALRSQLSGLTLAQHRRVMLQLIDTGLLEEAGRALASRRQRQPPGPLLDWTEGQLALAQGRVDEAVTLLSDAIEALHGFTATSSERKLAEVWRAKGDLLRAIAVLERAASTPPWRMTAGWSVGYEWIKTRAALADLYRVASRPADAQAIEAELLQLLAVADDDHPLKVKLLRRTSARSQ